MQRLSDKRLKVALWVVLAMALVVLTVGTLYAAGEELERGAVLSGGGTWVAGGLVLRDVIGSTAAGGSIAGGMSLCSGFGCDVRTNVEPDDPDDPNDPDDPDDPDDPGNPNQDVQLYMPQIGRQ